MMKLSGEQERGLTLAGDAALSVAAVAHFAMKMRHWCPVSLADSELVVDHGDRNILFRLKASVL